MPGRAPGDMLQNKRHTAPAVRESTTTRVRLTQVPGAHRATAAPRAAADSAIVSRWRRGLPEQLLAGDKGGEVSTGQAGEWLFLRGVQRWHRPARRCSRGRDHSEERHGAWSSHCFAAHLSHAWQCAQHFSYITVNLIFTTAFEAVFTETHCTDGEN